MFNDEELKIYYDELKQLDVNLIESEMKSILDFMYSLGVIAYDFNN